MESSNVVFNAVTSSVRQLCQFLRSIQFTTRAHVSIAEDGIHFLTESFRVMQGTVFIDKGLFSSYTFVPPPKDNNQSSDEEEDEMYSFQINILALLETLQVLGLSEQGISHLGGRDGSGISAALARGGPVNALSNRILGTAAICRLSYSGIGSPLNITLEESNITTTCSLTTYETEMDYDGDIPLQRDRLTLKIIMRSSLLLSAISELDTTSPVRLNLAVSPHDPNLTFSAVGPHSSASIEFSRDKHLLETFECGGALCNSYKFSMIKAASRAMAMSSKVSIRADENGVLSLQFLVESSKSGSPNFVDFRFGAMLNDEDEYEQV